MDPQHFKTDFTLPSFGRGEIYPYFNPFLGGLEYTKLFLGAVYLLSTVVNFTLDKNLGCHPFRKSSPIKSFFYPSVGDPYREKLSVTQCFGEL